MKNNVSDYRMRTFLQKELNNRPERKLLTGLRLCGKGTLNNPYWSSSVYILANDDTHEAKMWGTTTCHSTWACPYCAARVMAEKGAEIACAIDALASWYKQSAMMITFTLPHTKDMSAKETFELIKKTWRRFTRICKQKSSKRINKDGKTVFRGNNIWGKFREQLQIQFWVKVYEFTWGKNSWHPHIHALFWTPDNLLQNALEYEKQLCEYWWHCAKDEAKKLYTKKYNSVDKANEKINSLFADYKKCHPALFISKDKKGRVKKQTSAHYISGWGGESELTGSERQKHAKEGNYNPHDILIKAHELADNPLESKKWLDLYIEYCVATFRSRRVEFCKHSNISLKGIIAKWKKSEGFIKTFKKKCTNTKWTAVLWFSANQWLDILYKEKITGDFIVASILDFAVHSSSIESRTFKILDFLLSYDINCYENLNGDRFNYMWKQADFVANKIFEDCIVA